MVKDYNSVFWRKEDKKRIVCHKCLASYKTKDKELPVITKVTEFMGKTVAKITKPYKPYDQECKECHEIFDAKRKPVYTVGGKTYCPQCLFILFGLDYR
jgi:hypothetical protein